MYRTPNVEMAKKEAARASAHWGFCPLDGCYYVGDVAALRRIGCIERTAQAESVNAADDLCCFAEALAVASEGSDNANVQHFALLVQRAVAAYRATRGLDATADVPWTVEEILAREG